MKCLALLGLIVMAIPDASSSARPAQAFRYELLDAVVLYATRIDSSQYSATVRQELLRFTERARAYRPRPRPAGSDREMKMLYAAREGYEAKLVAAVPGTGVERLAQRYVDDLRPCYEWEGFHDCPEREARFAEQYLVSNPTTPFRDFLPLLAAHRWICAAEGYELEDRPQDAARARAAAAAPLATALKASSLLIRTAAQELQARARCHAGSA
jgi:hypothetical protein